MMFAIGRTFPGAPTVKATRAQNTRAGSILVSRLRTKYTANRWNKCHLLIIPDQICGQGQSTFRNKCTYAMYINPQEAKLPSTAQECKQITLISKRKIYWTRTYDTMIYKHYHYHHAHVYVLYWSSDHIVTSSHDAIHRVYKHSLTLQWRPRAHEKKADDTIPSSNNK